MLVSSDYLLILFFKSHLAQLFSLIFQGLVKFKFELITIKKVKIEGLLH